MEFALATPLKRKPPSEMLKLPKLKTLQYLREPFWTTLEGD